MKDLITRRDLMKGMVASAMGATCVGALLGKGRAAGISRVVLVRDPRVFRKDGSIDVEVLGGMLDEAVVALLGAKDPRDAWARLISPGDVVGIKSNVWHYLPTPKELEELIKERIVQVGVNPQEVSVDDRGVRLNPVFQKATALVNVRPLRTHFWSGIGGCIKNYIMFVPNPSQYHEDGCAHLGAIWNQPMVKGKTRINILCALTPQFYGRGPHFFDKRYLWPYCGLFVSQDPVAVDALGAKLLAAKRWDHFGEDKPLDTTPHHIDLAQRIYGLGVSDPKKIELIRLGSDEGSLI
jgi:hypothetical protein